MKHRHSFHFVFGENLVRCINGFECNFSEKASEELEKALPDGSKVEFSDSDRVYVVTLGGQYLCTMTDYQGGHLYVRDFKGSKGNLDIFQAAIDKALGIYNPIIIGNLDTSAMSAVAP